MIKIAKNHWVPTSYKAYAKVFTGFIFSNALLHEWIYKMGITSATDLLT